MLTDDPTIFEDPLFSDINIEIPDLEFDPAIDAFIDSVGPEKAMAIALAQLSAAVASAGKAKKTTIRIPPSTLKAYKARAKALGIPYQTLMNRQLREGMRTFPCELTPPISKH